MNLSHVDEYGKANMVDVSDKSATEREARAFARVSMQAETLEKIRHNTLKKGDVLAVARVAGIQAAKKCAELIPLCHAIMLSKIAIDFILNEQTNSVDITSYCKLNGQTGVEMEALTAVTVAALTIFDMCKAVDMGMVIEQTYVMEKSGGRRGHYIRQDVTHD